MAALPNARGAVTANRQLSPGLHEARGNGEVGSVGRNGHERGFERVRHLPALRVERPLSRLGQVEPVHSGCVRTVDDGEAERSDGPDGHQSALGAIEQPNREPTPLRDPDVAEYDISR